MPFLEAGVPKDVDELSSSAAQLRRDKYIKVARRTVITLVGLGVSTVLYNSGALSEPKHVKPSGITSTVPERSQSVFSPQPPQARR